MNTCYMYDLRKYNLHDKHKLYHLQCKSLNLQDKNRSYMEYDNTKYDIVINVYVEYNIIQFE